MRAGSGVWQQVWLVAGLRWRLLRNSLRSPRKQLELIGTLLVTGLGGLVALGGALGFAAGSYAAVRRGSPQLLTVLLWAIFLAWQLLPVLIAAFASGTSLRGLLVLPLRFRAFFLLHLAYGIFDPAGIIALVWLGGVLVGVGLAAPQGLAANALLLLGFALCTLLLNRLLYLWLERLLARRRTREALFLIFVLTMFGLQFVGLAAERWGKNLAPLLQQVYDWTQILPPGLVGAVVAGGGSTGAWLGALLGLCGYGVGCGWLLRRRLLAQYRGEDLSETATVHSAQAVEEKASSGSCPEFPNRSPRCSPRKCATCCETASYC
jgi:ABC-2 type transport system permease protein